MIACIRGLYRRGGFEGPCFGLVPRYIYKHHYLTSFRWTYVVLLWMTIRVFVLMHG
jgi:hypothetical protein